MIKKLSKTETAKYQYVNTLTAGDYFFLIKLSISLISCKEVAEIKSN